MRTINDNALKTAPRNTVRERMELRRIVHTGQSSITKTRPQTTPSSARPAPHEKRDGGEEHVLVAPTAATPSAADGAVPHSALLLCRLEYLRIAVSTSNGHYKEKDEAGVHDDVGEKPAQSSERTARSS